MTDEVRKRDARSIFRFLATTVSVVCFIFAVAFRLFPVAEDTWVPVYIFCGVGALMAGIALTGNFPWWGRDKL
jgi:hypothetical protein